MGEGFKTIIFKPHILKHHIPEHPKEGESLTKDRREPAKLFAPLLVTEVCGDLLTRDTLK